MVDLHADAGEQMIVRLREVLDKHRTDPTALAEAVAAELEGEEALQIARNVSERELSGAGAVKSLIFQPKRGAILLCDFDMARVPPEMRKRRRCVVVSPRSYNAPKGHMTTNPKPGLVIVVPLGASEPVDDRASHVSIAAGRYKSLTVPVWAICETVAHVSHNRLTRVSEGGVFLSEHMRGDDMLRIDEALRHALGLLVKPALAPSDLSDLAAT